MQILFTNGRSDSCFSGKFLMTMFLTVILAAALMTFFSSVKPAVAETTEFWQQQLEQARQSFAEDESLLSRYQLAVSRANTGELMEAYEMLKKFEDDFDQDKLEEEIAFELRLVELGSENLLYLNYAAFFYSITDDYEKSADLFAQISELDSGNIWPRNYKAVILIEELEDYDRALKVLDRALDIEENDYSYLLQGLAHYRAGNYLRAVNSLRQGRGTLEEIEVNL